jgi:uncharacterized protein YndB with AHSA1/START domain
MAAIVEEITIDDTPRRVYNALTLQDEIVRWWAYEAQVKPELGSVGEYRFRQWAYAMQLEVAELAQDKKVRWMPRQVPPQWAGTSVTWQLEPISNGTRLLFTHDGFTQIDEEPARAWNFFLASLKSYLETGKGSPGNPPGF